MAEHEHLEDERTDVDKLQDIMKELPDSNDFTEERRAYSLTKGDVLLIYKIAKIAGGHVCPFEDEESNTLASVAKNINRTQKLASGIIITAMVGATLSGVWFALKHVFLEWVSTGGHVK